MVLSEFYNVENKKIAVLGGGSMATALVKVLSENNETVFWWMRNQEVIEHIQKYGHNPRYLSNAELNTENIHISQNIDEICELADIIILVIPSAFLRDAMEKITVDISEKIIFSSIKGIVPGVNMIVGEYLNAVLNIPLDNIGVIAGPCHAEEVALERLSYLTLASIDMEHAYVLGSHLSCRYMRIQISDDIYGTEYAAVLKNIYSIAAGICHGLGYGDNFQAVLVSNALREMKRFIKAVHPIKRDIAGSAYMGDLLVTAYSQFSRNRTLGTMVGKGYSVQAAMLEMRMVAEGYYATELIRNIKKAYDVKMPIANAVYKILYEGKPAAKVIEKLSRKFT
ncbi:NAD(P)H-dependent glycerol-3-phosphate dehydrogenase [Schleiferia thermophila]|uniref:Glycerol-3-phosphate dehydrogenase [NAD(P)+] n=1 Tax=Schleiferia thermophila TaxID=884107 RepID=A0A369A854_9FLAO|nr:NAD(P)H-dependent glycerol-3-phosphate dehydrogenase [Schleiferia thermophila]KFD38500.1 glycerol-3-phosphate dehydrogenase [Schleiferia thermophila str. Yellowstone]RCX03614.1 glycerol-3-phosphate dehydrogenase (NAD(P)+) [Schleiferia thermophila]GCD79849.1 glycerol-3-phosphate dehydrogenase [Schleiferia thermophila]